MHRWITATGFAGGERTTRPAVAEVKARFAAGQRRVFRPSIPEPELWPQIRLGRGPTHRWTPHVVVVRVAGLVEVSGGDTDVRQTPPTLSYLDAPLRRLGGLPAYALTDNEKTVTVEHIADIAVRNPQLAPVS
ncbi:hypothetical protein K1W54_07085 [Micromonospora sp. CPCC 205371]|nr:hypothetical protein [Micromonospora sp. CPCC 205371]